MSLVLPDSVFVKKRRFTPPLSYFFFPIKTAPGPLFCQITFSRNV